MTSQKTLKKKSVFHWRFFLVLFCCFMGVFKNNFPFEISFFVCFLTKKTLYYLNNAKTKNHLKTRTFFESAYPACTSKKYILESSVFWFCVDETAIEMKKIWFFVFEIFEIRVVHNAKAFLCVVDSSFFWKKLQKPQKISQNSK